MNEEQRLFLICLIGTPHKTDEISNWLCDSLDVFAEAQNITMDREKQEALMNHIKQLSPTDKVLEYLKNLKLPSKDA